MRFRPVSIASAVVVVGLSVTVAACGGGNGNGTTSTSGASSGKKIALLLPEHTTARYETQDRPHFESTVKSLCPTCSVIYENANQNASEQQSQAESVLTRGVDAMVLDPVDATSASTIVRMANAQHVPVMIMFIPDRNETMMMVEAQPATMLESPASQCPTTYSAYTAANAETAKPHQIAKRSGASEKPTTPCDARRSILNSGYLVSPAARGRRWKATSVCRKPSQANMPRTKRSRSGIA